MLKKKQNMSQIISVINKFLFLIRAISGLRAKMTQIYSSANISLPTLDVKAQGEIEYGALMGKIRDPAILNQLWKSWRIQVGEKIRPFFLSLIKRVNKAAQENGNINFCVIKIV